MLQSQFSRKLGLVVAVVGFLVVAGCSGQQDEQAANQAPKRNQAAKAAPRASVAKPAVAKGEAPKVTPVSAKTTRPAGPVITMPKGTQLTAIVARPSAAQKIMKVTLLPPAWSHPSK